MEEYFKNAHKTKESMRELLKIQSKRLKELNQKYKELEKERKRTYKEMIYFKNQCRKKTKEIDILKGMINNRWQDEPKV